MVMPNNIQYRCLFNNYLKNRKLKLILSLKIACFKKSILNLRKIVHSRIRVLYINEGKLLRVLVNSIFNF